MWRRTSSKLFSLNPLSSPSPSRYVFVRSLHSSSSSSSSVDQTAPSNPSPSDSLRRVGFQSTSDGIRAFASSAAVSPTVDLASLSVLSGKDVVSMARHYGRCYWELSKARLSMLVVATSGTGYVLGSGNAVDFMGLCCTCAGTMMVAASANSLNQVIEIKNDTKMKRTMQRPLPTGRISALHAVTWASSVGLAGTALLAYKTNMLAAGLAASNLVLYAFVYTPLKQIHPVNTWVGAVVGAIPPLLGWAAASGQVSLNSVLLPAALYFWQIPHFMALAYLCRNDYAAGGYKMLSLADASGIRTATVALRNSIYLIPLGFLAYDWGMTTGWFCLESTLLTLAITGAAFSFYRDRNTQNARKMFHASLLYLPIFMSGLLLHRIPDNHQDLTANNPEVVNIPSSTLGEEDRRTKPKSKVKHPTMGTQARPPVAYASIAPFPFLPVPYSVPRY